MQTHHNNVHPPQILVHEHIIYIIYIIHHIEYFSSVCGVGAREADAMFCGRWICVQYDLWRTMDRNIILYIVGESVTSSGFFYSPNMFSYRSVQAHM